MFVFCVWICGGGGRGVFSVPLNYSIPGHASATSAHAAVHSIPKYKKETAVPFLYLKRDTNTGGAEVRLSWNNIRWNTGNLLCPGKTTKTTAAITGNYSGEE